jgi:hypothetical protein
LVADWVRVYIAKHYVERERLFVKAKTGYQVYDISASTYSLYEYVAYHEAVFVDAYSVVNLSTINWALI